MTLRQHWVVALLISVLGVAAATADSETKPQATTATTPEAALKQFMEASKTGDADALVASLPAEQAKHLKDWLTAGENVANALNALVAVMDDKFGPDPKGGLRKIDYDRKKELGRPIKAYEVVGGKVTPEDGKAAFKVKATIIGPDGKESTREEGFIATKVAGGWKVMPVELEGANFDKGVAFLTKLKEVLEQGTKDVKAGKYKSHEEVRAAFQKELPRSLPGDTPLPRFMTSGTAKPPAPK
jgi:hypothetical protein